MREVEKEESIQCRIGELTVLTFKNNLRIRYFDAPDMLEQSGHDIEKALRAAALEDVGSASGILLWSIPLEKRLPAVMWKSRRIVYTPRHYNRYFVALKGYSFEDYLSNFSSKSRSTLKRKVRKFQEASGGTIDFREYGTPENISQFYQDAASISRISYQHVMFDMGLPDTPTFKKGLEEAAKRGAVRAYVLYLKGEPIAYLYCPFEYGVLSYQYLGYLQNYRHLSPGTVLQMLVFEHLFLDTSAQYFDFTQGGTEGSHKEFFSTDSAMCADIFVLKATAANAAYVLLHYLTDHISKYAGLVLEKLNVKSQVKAAIRVAKGAASK